MLSVKVNDLHRVCFFNVVQLALDDLKAQKLTTAQMDTGARNLLKKKVHCGALRRSATHAGRNAPHNHRILNVQDRASRIFTFREEQALEPAFSLCERERMHP